MPDKSKTAPVPAQRFWDPFSTFPPEMDRLLDNFAVGRFPSLASLLPMSTTGAAIAPSVDVHENDKEIVIEAELPGIEEKDIDVTMQNHVLTIKGEKKIVTKEDKDDYHMMERRYGSFQRSMRLPDTVDEDNVAAKFDKGVLTVTLTKLPGEESKTRKIDIASD